MTNQQIQKALDAINNKKIEKVEDDFPTIKRTFTYNKSQAIKAW